MATEDTTNDKKAAKDTTTHAQHGHTRGGHRGGQHASKAEADKKAAADAVNKPVSEGAAFQASEDGPTDEQVQAGFANQAGSSDPADRKRAENDGLNHSDPADVQSVVDAAGGDPIVLMDAFISAAAAPAYHKNGEIQRMAQVLTIEGRGAREAQRRLAERAARREQQEADAKTAAGTTDKPAAAKS